MPSQLLFQRWQTGMSEQVLGKSQEVWAIRIIKESTLGVDRFIRVSPPSTPHAICSILNDALIKDPESYWGVPWMPVDPNVGVAQLLGAVLSLNFRVIIMFKTARPPPTYHFKRRVDKPSKTLPEVAGNEDSRASYYRHTPA